MYSIVENFHPKEEAIHHRVGNIHFEEEGNCHKVKINYPEV